jgi:hypothetical protein
MLVVTQVYHFTVTEDGRTIYSSLDKNICFPEFDGTVNAVEIWVKNNYTKDCEDYDEY